MVPQYMAAENELKRGSAELMILASIEERARHGYEIAKLIDDRSTGVLRFHVASLYPMLYRMERRGWIEGKWVEKAGQRRRCHYRITDEGKRVLAAQRADWRRFVTALGQVAGVEYT
jgi:transcriptional regulator